MNEHIEIKIDPLVKSGIQKVYGDNDIVYLVETTAIPPWQRFMLYDENKQRIVDTTIEDALKPHEVKTKHGIKLRKQNVWDDGELHITTRRKEIECLKNYYPIFANSFELINPEMGYKSFDEYYNKFIEELTKYKTKIK